MSQSHSTPTFLIDLDIAALSGDPEATKVRDWRHKLQKAFLGKQVPKDEVRGTSPHSNVAINNLCSRICQLWTHFSPPWRPTTT